MITGCIYRFRLGRDASGAYVGELVDDRGVDHRAAGRSGRAGWGQGVRGHGDAHEHVWKWYSRDGGRTRMSEAIDTELLRKIWNMVERGTPDE